MGEYANRLRLTLATFNERGSAMYDDPLVVDAIRSWVDPEVECVSAGGVQGGSYRGVDGLLEMVREFASAFTDLTAEVDEVALETDDALVASVRYRGKGAVGGAPIDEAYVWAQRFRDGRAVSFVIDRDRQVAMRVAGIATTVQ